jgi:Domain of unknown function (DUF3303)
MRTAINPSTHRGRGARMCATADSWHNVGEGTGVAVCESDSAAAVYRWALNWAPVLDVTVEPVLDDAEARAVINAAYSG